MTGTHLVRVGALGRIGRFAGVDAAMHPRGTRVIVRTARGLETGEVLAEDSAAAREPSAAPFSPAAVDGPLLRSMTPTDHLLAARLEQNRQAALASCEAELAQRQLPATLLDAEQLFDGRTLVFYFLGAPPPELEPALADLAAAYEAEARLGEFAETLDQGCGPNCGQEGSAGQGCTTCTSCAVASACRGS